MDAGVFRALVLDELKRMRDPRAENPFACRMFITGMITSARIFQNITEDEASRLRGLAANAAKHHYSRTPWPETAEWTLF